MCGKNFKRECGDYQTPQDFADLVCRYLYDDLKLRPKYILEPTAGVGNFIQSSLKVFTQNESMIGIEMNQEYCAACLASFPHGNVQIKCRNFFQYDLSPHAIHGDETLVVGNPPWVTNADLTFNLPKKTNFKNLSGTDAITGASNFDICESVILKLIDAFRGTQAVIAMLCKTSVGRNVLQELNRTATKAEYVKMIHFNAAKVFGISASACVFVVKLSDTLDNASLCEVSEIENPSVVTERIRCDHGVLSAFGEGVKDFEGVCQREWRQGVKHDCAVIMELERLDDVTYKNKRNEEVKLEETLIFPLMKSSSFKQPIIREGFKKYVIVTQKKARQDTSYIEALAPCTWEYLNANKELFSRRKSSIYKGAPAFSMFGVGEYSYAKYKVGISGFYKTPLFSLLYNAADPARPIMLDDTTYFLSFEYYDDAYACMVLLNCASVQGFLRAISFRDAKRPYTKKVLQRLDLRKCFAVVSLSELVATEERLALPAYITGNIYAAFKKNVS